ncbi:MAG: exosome complex protein Rrp42 [Euryarchaeota archaeon]|nr:exosome complex protein Rrp42 [Euryarchaeota archaeon]
MGHDIVLSDIKRDYVHRLAAEGRREDGRGFLEFRNVEVRPGIIGKAEGSAEVLLGSTRVLAGVKMIIGTPYPDTPDKGAMATGVELNPIAAPDFESGPPREKAIELGRVVDRGIRESGLIDMKALCIEPGEKIWMAFIDIDILDFDGNLFDACSLAATAALLDAKVPISQVDETKKDYPLPISEIIPIQTTFAKLGDAIMVDPSLNEEQCMDVRLTVSTDQNGNIRAMQKGGGSGSFSRDEILETCRKARDIQVGLRSLLEGIRA